nr:MAG TPA: hypothetical protein [Bacteriophage sp.]
MIKLILPIEPVAQADQQVDCQASRLHHRGYQAAVKRS